MKSFSSINKKYCFNKFKTSKIPFSNSWRQKEKEYQKIKEEIDFSSSQKRTHKKQIHSYNSLNSLDEIKEKLKVSHSWTTPINMSKNNNNNNKNWSNARRSAKNWMKHFSLSDRMLHQNSKLHRAWNLTTNNWMNNSFDNNRNIIIEDYAKNSLTKGFNSVSTSNKNIKHLFSRYNLQVPLMKGNMKNNITKSCMSWNKLQRSNSNSNNWNGLIKSRSKLNIQIMRNSIYNNNINSSTKSAHQIRHSIDRNKVLKEFYRKNKINLFKRARNKSVSNDSMGDIKSKFLNYKQRAQTPKASISTTRIIPKAIIHNMNYSSSNLKQTVRLNNIQENRFKNTNKEVYKHKEHVRDKKSEDFKWIKQAMGGKKKPQRKMIKHNGLFERWVNFNEYQIKMKVLDSLNPEVAYSKRYLLAKDFGWNWDQRYQFKDIERKIIKDSNRSNGKKPEDYLI